MKRMSMQSIMMNDERTPDTLLSTIRALDKFIAKPSTPENSRASATTTRANLLAELDKWISQERLL